MERKTKLAFLCLVVTQAAHSVEEYSTKLYDVFPLTRFVSSLFSSNLAAGFAIANSLLVGFGVWCWIVPVRSGWVAASALVWFWALVELSNGIAHCVLAASRGGYFPGLATAPFLIVIATWLAILQMRQVAKKS